MRRSPALALALALAFSLVPERAGAIPVQTNTGVGTEEITRYDIGQLLQALDASAKSPLIKLEIVVKPASDMPVYDSIFWYAGITTEGDKKIARIWKSAAVTRASVESNDRLEDAKMLAVMDYGFAGDKWKKLYDDVSQADAALGQSATDRYKNRHALVKTVQDFIADAQHRPHS
jgi:hypothetical protein